MSRPTGGVQPSVRPGSEQDSGDSRNEADPAPSGPGPGTPRPRSPAFSGGYARPAPGTHPPAGGPADDTDDTDDEPSGRRARRADAPGADGAQWLQQEIARRVAGRAGESGRHARVEPSGTDPAPADPGRGTDGSTDSSTDSSTGAGPEDSTVGPGDAAGRRPVGSTGDDPYGSTGGDRAGGSSNGSATGTTDGSIDDAANSSNGGSPNGAAGGANGPGDGPGSGTNGSGGSTGSAARPAGPRPRSTRVPDPYAPDGLRDGGKQWPPSEGGAGLPRRVPGATTSSWNTGWTPDPEALHAGAPPAAEPADAHPETRPVPTRWTAAGRRSTPAAASAPAAAPPRTTIESAISIPGPAAVAPPAEPAADPLADPEPLDAPAPDDDLRGHATERTEVIWRAPDLDDPVAPAPVPEPSPAVSATAPTATAPAVTGAGARPRRFAGAPAVPATVTEGAAEDTPDAGRVRIVLSERRSTTHSSRGLSDVQDPGAVGTVLRNSLVRTQLFLTARVGLVALLGLGMLPALFVAVPAMSAIEILGIRLPWLLLGFLVYPFLFGLGWWHVRSAERAEQEFADAVADR
ncbi:hypothetical protein [Pseudonocardia sp. HH130630-07]|uniref:hypothetical protein n=1 Tax=Pseudonocardia sp. HH130630-07 TaxID=1690815 RepID=UPI000AF10CCF|nr:hypothetical protein [Pseudonocardia sp. HH130630-07]